MGELFNKEETQNLSSRPPLSCFWSAIVLKLIRSFRAKFHQRREKKIHKMNKKCFVSLSYYIYKVAAALGPVQLF